MNEEKSNYYGDIFMDAKYLNCEEGTDFVTKEISKLIEMVQSHGGKLRCVKMQIGFVIPGNDDNYHHTDGPIDITIDKNEFDRALDYETVTDVNLRNILQYLKKHAYNYIDKYEFTKIIDEMKSLYYKIPWNSDITMDEDFDWEDPFDLNRVFGKMKCGYRIRKVNNGNSYQILEHRELTL